MRNLPVIYDLARSQRITNPMERKAGINFCIEAEKEGVYLHFLRIPDEHSEPNHPNFYLVGGSPRWGFGVAVRPALNSPGIIYDYNSHQNYCGSVNSKVHSGDVSLDLPLTLNALKEWQNRPDPSFTAKEMAAWLDYLLASDKYWSEREDALPLSPEDTERAKSWAAWVEEKYPLFSTMGPVDWNIRPDGRFDPNCFRYSAWEMDVISFETYKLLQLTFSNGQNSLSCSQNIYPPLEEMVSGEVRDSSKIAYSISGFPEIGTKKGQEVVLAQPEDLERYIDWLGK